MDAQQRWIGCLLILLSAGVFSTAGLFVKGVDADAWTILFWRGLFAAMFTTLYVASTKSLHREFTKMGRPGILAALIGASGTIAFIPSFKFTSIANVSLIYACSPLVSALIAWFWFREKPSSLTLVSSIIAFLGVAVIVSGSVGHLNLTGDLLALWMTLAMAGYLCIYRRHADTPAAGPAVILSLILVPPGWFIGDPLSAPLNEIALMATFGFVFAVASVTLAEGAKRLPAAETSLLSSLETPLAPFWAFLILSEIPASTSIIGGVVIFLAVLTPQIVLLVRSDNKPSIHTSR